MISVQEIISEVTGIKNSSNSLALIVEDAANGLSRQANMIQALVRGSNSGQMAVMAVMDASNALKNAAGAMSILSTTCDECIARLAE